MERRELLRRASYGIAIGAVLLALLVFKVRIAVANGKLIVALAVIITAVWLINRGLRR